MNSLKISKILTRNKHTKPYFKGVFSSNNIPYFNNYPYCVVANTDKLGFSGTHWIAIYVKDSKKVEYFDSYGESPNEELLKYMSKYEDLTLSKYELQSPFSDSCGYYCIFFLVQRCSGSRFDAIIKMLKSNPLSDIFVKFFVRTKL